MIISTNAIVLKTIRYGDSSIISRLYTESHGKIAVMAKGIWKPKNTTGPIGNVLPVGVTIFQSEIRDYAGCGGTACQHKKKRGGVNLHNVR